MGFAHGGLQCLLELLNQLFMGGIHFGIGQRSLGMTIGKRVSHALLASWDIFTAKHIEQFNVLQILRFGFFDRLQN